MKKETRIFDVFVYYDCFWIINKDDLDHVQYMVFNNPLNLDYEISINPDGYKRTAKSGYFMLQFIIKVMSKTALDKFVEKAGKYIGLIHWNDSTEDLFDRGHKKTDETNELLYDAEYFVEMIGYGNANIRIKEARANNPELLDF